MTDHPTVTREEWLKQRLALLDAERRGANGLLHDPFTLIIAGLTALLGVVKPTRTRVGNSSVAVLCASGTLRERATSLNTISKGFTQAGSAANSAASTS